MTNDEIVTAIKYHRENNELSSQYIAGVLGHTPGKYSKIENGTQPITAVELKKIADHLEMTMDELVTIPRKRK